MSLTHYFHFRQEVQAAQQAISGGHLSFLPLEQHYQLSASLNGIFIELDALVMLELRGTVDLNRFRLDLADNEIGFWQLYQFIGPVELYLPFSLPLAAGRCLSFSGKEGRIPLVFQEGWQWAVLIGYKKSSLPPLLREFPMMSSLVYGDGSYYPPKRFFFEPDMPINQNLHAAWGSLAAIHYGPFSGQAELLLALCKLLEIYCMELDRQADKSVRSRLALYYRALMYIHEHLLDSISKQSLVEGLQVHVRTLERAFQDRPIKLAEYIQRAKLNTAKELLSEEHATIDQVANALNFPNRKYFSREFKKYFGQTPRVFQEEMQALYGLAEEDLYD